VAGEPKTADKMTTLTNGVIQQISSIFPIQTSQRTLSLKRIWAEDTLDPNDVASQLQAKHNEQTWGVPIRAEMELIDNITGKPISKSTIQLARVPKLTSRYSFIVDGGEYQVDHLLRLKSGIYTRVKRNGDLVSEFNLRKGGSKNFDLLLDRKKSLINFKTKSGDAKIPAYPLLKVMGVDDAEMEKSWGKAVFEANKVAQPEAEERALRKFWEKTAPPDIGRAPSMEEMREHIFRYFDDTQLFPDTTKATLGHPFEKVTGGALLAASNKLLKLERREVEPDDRDSLIFKEVVHVEDFIPEKLDKNNFKKRVKNKVLLSIGRKNVISEIMQGGDLFNRPIKEFFTQGGNVSERSEQTNPVQMLSGNFKTTVIAKDYGGIKDPEKVGEEMQGVNPSHFAFLDPMHTPESERTGITLHLGSGVRKEGRSLSTTVVDLKTGKLKDVTVPEFHTAMVVLPDQVKKVDGKYVPIAREVKVKLPGGDISRRPYHEADFLMPTAKAMFSYTSNLIPFLPCDQGNRASMADKQMEQAISLKNREAPLVQSLVRSDNPTHSFEKLIGTSFAAHRAPVDGKVTKITADGVHVHDGKTEHKVQLYNHFPLNDPTTMLHSQPVVKVGDQVKAGQVVADSNFTRNGTLALGTNLHVGYIPYKGYNFEDGIVISESASQKLTSEHLHKLKMDVAPEEDVTSKKKWMSYASHKATSHSKDKLSMLDDDGVIKEGSRVTNGQVLATCLTPNKVKSQIMVERFGNKAIKPWKDKSLTWDSDYPGIVTRVVKSPNGKSVKVFVKTEEAAEIGDKLSGRHGNKGIITKILPDHEMPFVKKPDGTDRPLDVLLNPSGVPTRMNIGQVLETAAGKVAEKTGSPFFVNNFAGSGHDYRKQVVDELAKHGLSDEEEVFDPSDRRRPLGKILVGPQHLLKLKHQVEKKLVVRGGGSDLSDRPYKYDQDMQPVKGGASGGQGFGSLELYSLLGHNARHNLREMTTYKADMQGVDFWRMIQEGREPPPPKIPFAYTKFEGLLRGLGVDVRKEGTSMRLVPMTDREVLKIADNGKNEIRKPLLFTSKGFKPEKGGLFDPAIVGSRGEKWSYIKLHEPVPNPLFVGDKQNKGPIPSLLSLKHGDISVQEVDKIMSGQSTLDGKVGGRAIADALKSVNVEEEIKKLREELPTKRGSKRDQSNRTLKYLLALKDLDMKPHEAYVLQNIPVLPAAFRPVTPTARGDVAKSSLNDLYKTVGLVNEKMKVMPAEKYGHEMVHELRGELWNSMKALQAVGDYTPIYDKESFDNRELKGIVDLIGGDQPKEGYFQEKLVKRKQDLSIRSTIVPEPSLHIDEIGLPRVAAMELYKPFVVAHMHSRYGYTPSQAMSEMKAQSDHAKKALDEVMKDRPLLLKRDPALHKFSVQAFRPKTVEGKAIKIHPLVCGGFNADFDGDTMAGTVPISQEAVEEAKKMFPSRNLFSPTTYGAMHIPSQEFLLGLHLISKWGKDSGKTVKTVDELSDLVDKGLLTHTDVVRVEQVGNRPTTLGRLRIESRLPRDFAMRGQVLYDPEFEISKKPMGSIVTELAKKHPGEFDKVVNNLKDLGTEQSFKHGFSLSLKDFAPLPERDQIVAEAQHQAAKIDPSLHSWEREAKLVEIFSKATEKLDAAARVRLPKEGSHLGAMVYSGARGKPEQLRQMIAAPMLVQDSTGRVVPFPITRSYGEGLDVGDYWLAQHGARKGTLQRASGTREPGAMTKDIINSTISTLITSEDCGTQHGILMPLDPKDPYHLDVYDRFLAKDHGPFKAGEQVTPALVDRLRQVLGKDAKIQVRSPLKCQHGEGVCSKCFGLNENGKLHPVGTNIGVLAGQALGEPATQLAMDAFHTGGIASGRGGGSVSRIQRLKDLLKMPKILKGSAILAKTTGTVTGIKPDPGLGGHVVTINGIDHHIREGEINPALVVGAEVRRGESLSHEMAPIHPKELLHITKDMHGVQRHLVDELYRKLYKDENVRPRNIELVVRSLTNYTRIKDPGSSQWDPGDVVPHSLVEEFNRNNKGKTHEQPITHEPMLPGSGNIPNQSTDWMARLNYQRLKQTLQRGASQAWKSDIHGAHPIPGIAYGKEFGAPPKEVTRKKPFAY
jgi:DNA-directed RNA polymerase subunit beta'